MEILRNFANSAIASIRESVDEMMRMVRGFDTTKITDGLMEFNDNLRDGFEKIKQRIRDLDDKFVVEVDYDRNCDVLSYSLNNNVLTVKVNAEEGCGCDNEGTEQSVMATIPDNVDVTTMKCKYNSDENKMLFIFKKFNAVEEEEIPLPTEEDAPIPMETELETVGETEETFEVELENIDGVEEEELSFEERKMIMAEEMKLMHDEGVSYRKIAKEFGVSDKTVARWIREIS